MKKLGFIIIISCVFAVACTKPAEKVVENKSANTTNVAKTESNTAKPETSNFPAMPDDILQAEMKTIDGKTFKLGDQKGKVLLVNLWATWCAPCVKEMPEIQKLNDEFKDKGFEAIGVTFIDEDNPDKQVRDFLKEKKFTYTQVLSNEKTWDAMLELSKAPGIPVNFIVSKDGKILETLVGGKSYEAFKAAIEKGF
jgi:cytochrome c biogenesis protein CcmG, thiol:disulfide interchange protein DsbE